MSKLALVVIPELDEGKQLNDTLDSLFDTSDRSLYDVVVVSDGSTVGLELGKYGNDVTYFHSNRRQGVGASFDAGVGLRGSKHLILMGSDIRFRDNGYMDKMLNYLEQEENEKSLISTVIWGLNSKRMDVDSEIVRRFGGSRTLLFIKAEDLPSKGAVMNKLRSADEIMTYRDCFEAKWLDYRPEESLFEIPCILGAFYGVRRDWYNHIQGFQGHRRWGSLEPFISLKSWLADGKCKCAQDIEVAHIFKGDVGPSHVTHAHDKLYNKFMIAHVVFPENEEIFRGFLGQNQHIRVAEELFRHNKDKLNKLRDNFQKVRVHDIHWYNERWPFKYYKTLFKKNETTN